MVEAGPVTNNRIDELWNDHNDLAGYLQSNNQLGLHSRVHDSFRKTLIIAAASYFEVQLTETIVGLYGSAGHGAGVLAEFVRRQAIERRFAQLFQWKERNANSFYSLFGRDFADHMKQKIRSDQCLDDSVKAFLEIGNLRNQLVHENYADFRLEKTVDEIYELYRTALYFLRVFPVAIRQWIEAGNASGEGEVACTA